MLTDEQFRTIYGLLDSGQTVDDEGDPIDCGRPCRAHCCSPAMLKHLLPGEQEFLERESDGRPLPYVFKDLTFYMSAYPAPGANETCMCVAQRTLRPFACRAFPYAPVVVDRRVVGIKRNFLKALAPCWITEPGARWAQTAQRAWQIVLDDVETRFHFAKLATLWEWNAATERGEDPGPVLMHLMMLKPRDDVSTWDLARRFFERSDP